MKVANKTSLGLCKKDGHRYWVLGQSLNFLLSTAEYSPSKVLTFLWKTVLTNDVVKSRGNSPDWEERFFIFGLESCGDFCVLSQFCSPKFKGYLVFWVDDSETKRARNCPHCHSFLLHFLESLATFFAQPQPSKTIGDLLLSQEWLDGPFRETRNKSPDSGLTSKQLMNI